MSVITVRNLDDDLKPRMRVRAPQHGRSTESEAHEISRQASVEEPAGNVASWIHERFAGLELEELEFPPRTDEAQSADFKRSSTGT